MNGLLASFFIIFFRQMTFESLPLVGQGARHIVVSVSPTTVCRIEKDESRNTFEECTAKLEYHERVVMKFFAPFVPMQRVVQLKNLFVMEAEYVQLGTVCVELKPKWIGGDSFVSIQKRRGYVNIFHPDGLWSGEKELVEKSLWSAFECDKPYLKIHRGGNPEEAIHLVACALMERKIFSVLETIDRVSKWADATQCLPIAQQLVQQLHSVESTCDILDLDEEQFVATGRTLIAKPDPVLGNRWINSYLTGRMARDVSLMFSFAPSANSLGEPVICIGDMFCRLAVIDTEIKPRSKISS